MKASNLLFFASGVALMAAAVWPAGNATSASIAAYMFIGGVLARRWERS